MRRFSSPALVVAMLALFISLTGNAVAVRYLVTSSDIKDGTIQVRDLSYSARAALRGAEGPRGFLGPPGPQGLQGSSVSTYLLESRLSDAERKLSRLCGPSGAISSVTLTTYVTLSPYLSVYRVIC